VVGGNLIEERILSRPGHIPSAGLLPRDHFYLAKSVLNSTILPCLLGGGSLYPALTSDNGEARFNKI